MQYLPLAAQLAAQLDAEMAAQLAATQSPLLTPIADDSNILRIATTTSNKNTYYFTMHGGWRK